MSLTSLITSSSSLVYHITSNQENLNLQTLFGTSKYQAKIDKRIIIASGVTLGATTTGNYALNMPSGFGGRLILVNEGSILGAGGAANGGTGGNCINAGASNIYIDNRGTISSGGGGGGKGGTGGQGYTTSTGYNAYPLCTCPTCCGKPCSNSAPCSGGTTLGNGCAEGGLRWFCPYTSYTYYNGGTGGNGGRGQGYDAGAASGSGGATGGTNAGTGGTGGTGGSYGSSGNNGNIGANGNYTNGSAGSSGGLAGFYIVNNGNVNWVANGTRNGRIG